MKHVQWVCNLGAERCDNCDRDSHSELFTCKICGASEGELTTECPGFETPPSYKDRTFRGELDYYGGKWVVKKNAQMQESEL